MKQVDRVPKKEATVIHAPVKQTEQPKEKAKKNPFNPYGLADFSQLDKYPKRVNGECPGCGARNIHSYNPDASTLRMCDRCGINYHAW